MFPQNSNPNTQHIIVGAGAAGLSLAYALTRHPATATQAITLLDPNEKRTNDRTWSYWERADRPGLFAELPGLVSAEWATAEVRTSAERLVLPLAPYVYRTIRGLDFYDAMRAHLARQPQVQWVRARIDEVIDGPTTAIARTPDGREFRGTWLYDSRFRYADLPRATPRHVYLAQHFVGWEIEATRDVFDPAVATLFDFRTPQRGAMRFHYILPHDARRALVEFTLFSADLLPPAEYVAELRRYLREEVGLAATEYRIVGEEAGVIPMTDHPSRPREAHSQRGVQIGARGGASEPS
ncbi:MAG: NAD(P)-binding protein, partial [Hymenobacteraceae bacterium]|nr:NAD(P)-binding protein [Hymenobacteraceae bacterium]